MRLIKQLFKTRTSKKDLEYLISFPEKYNSNNKWFWPMILYLHGTMAKSTNINDLKLNGIPKIVNEMEDFPFITVSPLCPFQTIWSDLYVEIKEMIVFLKKDYRVNDIYLTGYNMGGHGVWMIASHYPKKFSAIAPVCSGPIEKEKTNSIVTSLLEVPVLVYHGRKDKIVPLQEAMKIPEKMREKGGDINVKLFDNIGHDCCIKAYTDPELYEWFISHHKSEGG
ncbi:MAG: dienelactone hydrolase family protein [Kosmotogaceae bacterium]